MSDKFRKFRKGILFTTDVSARGVDYPNVTHVIQYGGAEDKETYLHRLGRTGRAGKAGCGILVCTCPSEERTFVSRVLKGLELHHDGRIQALLGNTNVEELLLSESTKTNSSTKKKREEINIARLQKIRCGIGMRTNSDLEKMANNAYRSLLGYHITKMENLGVISKKEVVDHVNSLAMQMGYMPEKLPMIGPKIIQALGLNGVRGLNVGKEYHYRNENTSSNSSGDGVRDRRIDSGGEQRDNLVSRSREGRNHRTGGNRSDAGNPWSNRGVMKPAGKQQRSEQSSFQKFDDYRWNNF
jgi:ATP-dependent RNA helicase MSS116